MIGFSVACVGLLAVYLLHEIFVRRDPMEPPKGE